MPLRTDPRAIALAERLTSSLDLQKGDTLLLSFSDLTPGDLIREAYRHALHTGAFVELNFRPRDAAGITKTFYDTASDEQLTYISEVSRAKVAWANKLLFISCIHDEQYLEGIDPAKLSLFRSVGKDLNEAMLSKPWLSTVYPGESMAKNAGMTLPECIDYYYVACLADYDALAVRIKKLQDVLDAGKMVHIIGPGTDLRLGIEGRLAAGAVVGRRNIPDGESFLAPLEDQVDGEITYELPQTYDGHEVSGIHLTFEKGVITKASAESGEEYFLQVLNEHEGNKRFGELGIGMNPSITRYMKNLMFDEKIMGTVHMALGRAYTEERGGGKNWGTVHWDLVKDLRMPGTSVTVDDRVIMKDGTILI